ncbi:MAG: phosphate regulon sensor histidine kinase PhoR [Casimicrobiaceae bacterium]
MNSVVLAGLLAPAVVLASAALAWATFGAAWAVGILVLGNLVVVGYHLRNLVRMQRWAAGPTEAPVPDSGGPWSAPLAALHRRSRGRTAYQRGLAHTIERFRGAADAIPDGLVILDGLDRVRWANRRAATHLGLDLERDVGRPLANLVRQPVVVRYLETGDWSEPVIIDSQREPGTTLSVQVVPFGDEEKLLMSRDVTALEGVARMRRDFIANVSHELKTPLTVVRGFLETLQDLEVAPREKTRYLALMEQQTQSMQRLVDDLLTLSSLESQDGDLAETAFPMAPLIEEVAAEGRALSAGVHEIVIQPGPTAWVTGSHDELRSAFANLVSNAVRYTPESGCITLSWRLEDDGTGVFAVSDTGIGIAPDHIPRLTERFYRVDRGRSRATGGTGLGLAIVKHVLLRHHAELRITSEPGMGSTFEVRLPASRIEADATGAQGQQPRSAGG